MSLWHRIGFYKKNTSLHSAGEWIYGEVGHIEELILHPLCYAPCVFFPLSLAIYLLEFVLIAQSPIGMACFLPHPVTPSLDTYLFTGNCFYTEICRYCAITIWHDLLFTPPPFIYIYIYIYMEIWREETRLNQRKLGKTRENWGKLGKT